MMSARRISVALVLAVSFLVASPARAESLLLLPVSGSAARAPDATALMTRFCAELAAAGWRTQAVAAAQRERADALLSCDTSLCARAGLDSLAVDAVAAPAIWQRHDGRRELSVSVQGPSGRVLALTVVLPAAPPSAATAVPSTGAPAPPAPGVGSVTTAAPSTEPAASLAERFIARWPELRTAPARQTLVAARRSSSGADARPAPGAHGPAADDGADAGADDDPDTDPGAEATDLARGSDGRSSGGPSGLHVALGASILLASVPPMALGLTATVRDDRCVVVNAHNGCIMDTSGRIERYSAGARSIALVSVGIVGAGAGIALLAMAQRRAHAPPRAYASVDASPTSAVLTVAGTF